VTNIWWYWVGGVASKRAKKRGTPKYGVIEKKTKALENAEKPTFYKRARDI